MRNRQERRSAADCGKTPPRAAVQLELRRPAMPDDLDVAPEDAVRMAGAQRLHRGFLGGEAAGKMDRRHTAPRAVGNLTVREDPAEKSVAVPLDRVGDAVNVGGVETDADDVWHDVVNGA